MRQRDAVAHEEGPFVSRRVRPGRDAHTEPSRLHRGAQRNVSISRETVDQDGPACACPPRRRARGNRTTDAAARDGRHEEDSAVACKVLCVAKPDRRSTSWAWREL